VRCTKRYVRQFWPSTDGQVVLPPLQRIPRARYAIRTWLLTSHLCPMCVVVVRDSAALSSAPAA
jgi:hypothetical protein